MNSRSYHQGVIAALTMLLLLLAIIPASSLSAASPVGELPECGDYERQMSTIIVISTNTYVAFSRGQITYEQAHSTVSNYRSLAVARAYCARTVGEAVQVTFVLDGTLNAIQAYHKGESQGQVNSHIEQAYHAGHALKLAYNWRLSW